jgi:predicted nucleic-acid-binding protein
MCGTIPPVVIGIDTNILVKHFVQDDLDQGAVATHFLTTECTHERPGFIDIVVVCELAWVLSRVYRYPQSDILAVVRSLLATSTARVQDAQLVRRAADGAQRSGGDFPDHLILLLNQRNGCGETVTFDRRFARLSGARSLSS